MMMMTSVFGVPLTLDTPGEISTMVSPAVATQVEGLGNPKRTEPSADEPDQAFARLASLVRSNDRYLAELKALNARLVEARSYLASPSANVRLGQACLDRVRAHRTCVLAMLRANRLAAREFLAN